MCGKYTLTVGKIDERMQEIIEICNRTAGEEWKILSENFLEISPDCCAPALFLLNHKVHAVGMRWGFSGAKGLIINARSEDVYKRPLFKAIADRQRCALPAAGYMEWRDSDKLRYLITSQQEQPLYLAGLYQSDEKGKLHFVILTREAYGNHSKIHGRMPCLLRSREEARQWLSGKMTIDTLSTEKTDGLSITAQGFEQIQMDFED